MVLEEDLKVLSELPGHIQANIFKDFLFHDFLEQFKVHFIFTKPKDMVIEQRCFDNLFTWCDYQYAAFMTKILKALEPRFYKSGEYIFSEGEDVDEHIFVINRDPNLHINATGDYCVGFKFDTSTKYFHVKLGTKSIICGYENLFGKRAEYSYRALKHVDAYGLRKRDLKLIFY